MCEQEVKAQGACEGRLWPAVVSLAGLIVLLIGIVGSLALQFWAGHYGPSWGSASNVFIAGSGAGLVLMLFGSMVCCGPAEDKPDPLAGIERELAGLRQEVAALRVRLESGA